MRKDLTTSLLAIVVFTVLLGLAYPLATTGVAQVAFPGPADGSRIERGGRTVGSRLIGQDFKGRARYFQSRPSSTEYGASYTYFGNLGPNNRELSGQIRENLDAQDSGSLFDAGGDGRTGLGLDAMGGGMMMPGDSPGGATMPSEGLPPRRS